MMTEIIPVYSDTGLDCFIRAEPKGIFCRSDKSSSGTKLFFVACLSRCSSQQNSNARRPRCYNVTGPITNKLGLFASIMSCDWFNVADGLLPDFVPPRTR